VDLAKRRAATVLIAILATAFTATALAKSEHGTPRADKLLGTQGGDRLFGRAGPDELIGRRGADLLEGGKGGDRLIGGPGNDRLKGGPGHDQLNEIDGVPAGGLGNDIIDARDGAQDEINCGPGRDVAIVDASEEGVIDCEVVREPRTTGERR
jgi:Ca2+-binding RTX toxin-like protein